MATEGFRSKKIPDITDYEQYKHDVFGNTTYNRIQQLSLQLIINLIKNPVTSSVVPNIWHDFYNLFTNDKLVNELDACKNICKHYKFTELIREEFGKSENK